MVAKNALLWDRDYLWIDFVPNTIVYAKPGDAICFRFGFDP